MALPATTYTYLRFKDLARKMDKLIRISILIMRGEYVELPCPFCGKGRIVCLYFPPVWTEKRSLTATFGSRRTKRKTSETWIIQSGCNVCGKSREEVEKELKKQNFI